MKSLQVLIVTTSYKNFGDKSSGTGLWLEEFTEPYYVFRDHGECITITSPTGGPVPIDTNSESDTVITENIKRFKLDSQALYHLSHSLPLREVKAENFDLVFIAGGHGAMLDLANNETLISLLEDFDILEKPIGAVGSGVVALTSILNKNGTPYVKGKKITSISNDEIQLAGLTYLVPFLLETKLLSLGAFYSRSENYSAHTITDGKLVTGQNPASSAETATELLFVARHSTGQPQNIIETMPASL